MKDRVGLAKEDLKSVPGLIKLEFRLASGQRSRMASDLTGLQRNVAELQHKVDVMPRAVAEMVVELLAERGR